MPSFRRKASSVDELRMQVLLAYGPEARITDATRVTRKGLGRFFAHEEIEATVVVPDDAAPAGGVALERVDRVGIAALLADADEGDGGRSAPPDQGADASPGAASTSSRSFAALLADVERAIGPGAASVAADRETARDTTEASGGRAAASGPLTAIDSPAARAASADLPLLADRASAGDFVLVVGLGDDAATAARGLVGRAAGAPLLLHGTAADAVADIADRRAALTARMRAVEQDAAIVLAVSIDLDDELAGLAELRPDEVWAAVDVSRRTDDTAHWLARLDAVAHVAAVAAVGAARTRHPLDVTRFGRRIGWREASAGASRA